MSHCCAACAAAQRKTPCSPCERARNPRHYQVTDARTHKQYYFDERELEDTLFESSAWDSERMRARVKALEIGESITAAGETLERIDDHDGRRLGEKKRQRKANVDDPDRYPYDAAIRMRRGGPICEHTAKRVFEALKAQPELGAIDLRNITEPPGHERLELAIALMPAYDDLEQHLVRHEEDHDAGRDSRGMVALSNAILRAIAPMPELELTDWGHVMRINPKGKRRDANPRRQCAPPDSDACALGKWAWDRSISECGESDLPADPSAAASEAARNLAHKRWRAPGAEGKRVAAKLLRNPSHDVHAALATRLARGRA